MARPHWANAGGAVIPTVTSVATAVKMLVQRNRMGWFSLGIGLPSQANHVSCVRTVTHFTDLYFRQSWTICSSRRRSAIVSNLSAGPLPQRAASIAPIFERDIHHWLIKVLDIRTTAPDRVGEHDGGTATQCLPDH